MPERGVDTAPLTFYLGGESSRSLTYAYARAPLSLSLSIFLSLSFSPLSSSLSLSGYSGKSMFLRYFLFPSGACKTRVTGCGYLSSLPLLDSSKKGDFRYRSNANLRAANSRATIETTKGDDYKGGAKGRGGEEVKKRRKREKKEKCYARRL